MLLKVDHDQFHRMIEILMGRSYKEEAEAHEVYFVFYDGHIAGTQIKGEYWVSSILLDTLNKLNVDKRILH